MKCTYSLEELIGYLDGRMCDQEKEELQKHLEICEDCRNHIAALKLTDGYIKEDVKNDGTTYLKIMESIDKSRYQGKKLKYKVGAVLFKLAPILKPMAAVVLIIIIAATALNYREQISDVLSSLEQMVLKHDEPDKDDNKKEDDNKKVVIKSKFFKAEPTVGLKKATPPEGWSLSEDVVVKDAGNREQIIIKLYLNIGTTPTSSSKPLTGEVLAFLEDGKDLYEIGNISNYGIIKTEIISQDLNKDGINEIVIKGQLGASSSLFKVIGLEATSGKWVQLLDTNHTEVIDLDADGYMELVTTSVGSLPPFVFIYMWYGDHYEKLDVAEATGNEYANLINRGTGNIVFESGNKNSKHFYSYKNGELIEEQTDKIVYEKNNTMSAGFNTCVTKEVWGKQGPGENYDNVVKIPYGRVISIIGRYNKDAGWYLAKLTPTLSDERSEVLLPENQTEFWLNFNSISTGFDHAVNFDECTVNDAVRFNCVITGENKSDGTFHLKQLPFDNSPTVSIAAQGNLISVIRKDGQWSLIKIISGRAMTDYSDVGWIKNEYYAAYKPGIKINQGFITRPFRIYNTTNPNSDYPPLDNILKSNIAPVTILLDHTAGTFDWTKVSGGFNGFIGWVKLNDIKFSFTSEEAQKLANPEIDLKKLTQKIKKEIEEWEDLNLCALDLGKQTKLTSRQRKELADKLNAVTGYQVYGGGLTTFREAVYPFYTLQFLDGNNDYYMDEDNAEPPYKYYRASFCKFNFVVTGDDTLLIQIPDEKLASYGLEREGPPVKFIQVNKEFIKHLKKLIPVTVNSDKSSLNHLLNAVKVEVNGEQGDQPQQVYKAARVLNAFAGEKVIGKVQRDENKVIEFKFTFKDGSSEKVIVYENYMSYRGMYITLNGNPVNIGGILFTAYF